MCKTKGAPAGFSVCPRRRSKYTLEEKKGIAKTKAKKRRDEETKYFTEIENHLQSPRCPYVGLPDKLIHNASLRLTNAWKVSYHALYQIRSEPVQVPESKRKSLIQEIASDLILLTTHRSCETREASGLAASVFLYATPSVQNYIHVSGCHDIIGSKVDDFCLREEIGNSSFVELRAPLSQKDKRPYPAVRCRILRSDTLKHKAGFELGFFLLRAPLPHRGAGKASCAAILKRHLNTGPSTQDAFEEHGPQYWRAMQSRRRAILRGASRELVVPEQLKAPRRGPSKAERPVRQSSVKSSVQSSVQPVVQPTVQSTLQTTVQQTLQPTLQPAAQPPVQPLPSFSLLAELNEGNPPLLLSPVQPCCDKLCSPAKLASSGQSSPYCSNSLSLSPILSPHDIMNDIVQGDIDSPMVSLEQPNDVNTALTSLETPDVVCLDGLDSITPTIGLETDGLPVPHNEIEALKMMAAVGNPTDVCPCGLTTKAECLDILDSLTLKTEPQDSPFPVKQEFKEEEEKSEEEALMPKQECFASPDAVTFTADCEEDDLSRIRGFLNAEQLFPPPEPPKPFSCCGLTRTPTSGLLMDAQSSDDLVLFGELTDTCSAPRFIGDRQSSCQFDSIQEDPDDSISALLGTPMLVNSEICMTELNDLVGITKKMSETSMDD